MIEFEGLKDAPTECGVIEYLGKLRNEIKVVNDFLCINLSLADEKPRCMSCDSALKSDEVEIDKERHTAKCLKCGFTTSSAEMDFLHETLQTLQQKVVTLNVAAYREWQNEFNK